MENRKVRFKLPALLAGCVSTIVLTGASSASAEENWDYTAFIYLWGASLGGESVTGQSIDVSFSDILENLDFGIMGTLEARNGPWAFFGDGIYLNISKDGDAAFGPGIPASADADIKGLVATLGAGYDFVDSGQYRLNGFGGVRYLDMDTRVNLSVGGGSARVRDDFSNWDAIVGVRGQYQISDQWTLAYYGDIGAGDTDLTWQAAVGADYKFDKWTLTFGYRHLAWEGVNDSATLEDVEFSGPFVGAKFEF